MHLVHRKKNKKNSISTINNNQNKLLPYYQIANQQPINALLNRKKTIELILDKNQSNNSNFNDQILIYKKSLRKVSYQPQKTKKAESGILKCLKKLQYEDSHVQTKTINRQKSTSFHDKYLSYWGNKNKKYEMQHSPYIDNYRKTKSNTKFKAILQASEPIVHKDWVCEKLIQNQIYSVEQSNDFS